MKGYKFKGSCVVFCFSIGISLLAIPVWSADFCVNTADDLQSALTIAQSNGEDDIIRLRQGTYYGNFVGNFTETYSITIEGGYNHPRCKRRVVDPTTTVLDGQVLGSVLVLAAPDVAAEFVLDGVTIKNGNSSMNQGGGIYFGNTNGTASLSNNIIYENEATWNGGGIAIEGNALVILRNNKIAANISSNHGGGIYLDNNEAVSLYNNEILNNNSGSFPTNYIDGGGVYVNGSINVTLENNKLFGNVSGYNGGAARIHAGSITLTDNYIIGNTARVGGGLKLIGDPVNLMNNNISYNVATEIAGGIHGRGNYFIVGNIISNNTSEIRGGGGLVLYDAYINMINNIVVNNTAPWGGGAEIGTPYIFNMTNNTIAYNTAGERGGGIYLYLFGDSDEAAYIYNNIILDNSATEAKDLYIDNDNNNNGLPSQVDVIFNDFDQSLSGTYIQIPFPIDPSNLDNIDPLFVDPLNDDYHLSTGSPCLDAGMDAGVYDDIDGDIRPQGSGFDIGADEYVGTTHNLDLDITGFKTSNRVSLTRKKNIVEISLAVVNNGTVDDVCPATVVGKQNSIEVYSETINVSNQIGNGQGVFTFSPYTPDTAGDIVWTATIEDGDPDVDRAAAYTTVVP